VLRDILQRPLVFSRSSTMNETCQYILAQALQKSHAKSALTLAGPFLGMVLVDALMVTNVSPKLAHVS
jgi:hypothetical protein